MFEELIEDARQTPVAKEIIQLLGEWLKNRKYDDLFLARAKYRKLTQEEQHIVSLEMAKKGWLGNRAEEVVRLFQCRVSFDGGD